jgi:hypothetical protein
VYEEDGEQSAYLSTTHAASQSWLIPSTGLSRPSLTPHNFAPDGRERPAGTLVGMAVGR